MRFCLNKVIMHKAQLLKWMEFLWFRLLKICFYPCPHLSSLLALFSLCSISFFFSCVLFVSFLCNFFLFYAIFLLFYAFFFFMLSLFLFSLYLFSLFLFFFFLFCALFLSFYALSFSLCSLFLSFLCPLFFSLVIDFSSD